MSIGSCLFNRPRRNNIDSNREERKRLFIFWHKGDIIYMRENIFQATLIRELKRLFPGCVVVKNDANYIQGFPDLTILYKNNWATLECKKSLDEPYQPNQEYYIEVLNNMSFASMICPENKEAVLYELQQAFSFRRSSRFSKR